MTMEQINDALEGICLVNHFSNLYEYIGTKYAKYLGKNVLLFQNMCDDSYIEVEINDLRLPEYTAEYPD